MKEPTMKEIDAIIADLDGKEDLAPLPADSGMEWKILSDGRVRLTMSVEEFAALEVLRWNTLAGHPDTSVRGPIEAAFEAVVNAIDGEDRDLIDGLRDDMSGIINAERIRAAFDGR